MSTYPEATILLAEEDDSTRMFLEDNLTADGYRVLSAQDRAKAIALLTVNDPDLILVDVNGETLGLIDAVRSGQGVAGQGDPDTPMSHDADRLQRIRLLERGGDDVVEKPFSYPELRARIGAVLRRSRSRGRGRRLLRAGSVTIDVHDREVRVGDRRVELSATEYLLRSVWGFQTFGRTRTLDSHASRLRQKLRNAAVSKLVINVWGVGYRLCDAAVDDER